MKRIIFLALIFFVISCKKDETKTLIFKNYKVDYMSYGSGEKEIYENHSVTNEWELESAKRKLALCLCEKYLEKPDAEIKSKILELYTVKEQIFYKDYPKNMEFEIILKKRMEIFNPTILID